ncbi:MAG: penicillin-insensitive murein endopeptidase [Pyrinomonadaceae bacterium]|nr:penicillin-insensitive murein endopeptidase [Pyrinomonadaceae bacterium]
MDINTPLPESGVGFVTNNRGPNGAFQFGQKSTIDAALRVGAAWKVSHPHPFSIGQISKKGGGPMPPHQSHRLGVDVDVRPVRIDGQNSGVTIDDPAYDRAVTTALIEMWWQKAPVQLVLFNDQTVIAAGLSRAHPGHGNHFHVRLRMKGATIRIRDRGSDVAELQAKLGLTADGRFGPATVEAVEEFQAAHGLLPDGVVGRDTWAALGV